MTNTNTKPIDALDGFSGVTAVYIDRDPPNTRDFLAILAGWDIESVKLPPRSPNLSLRRAFLRTIKEGCGG